MFNCTVVGNMSGITTWRVGGTSECHLLHRSTSSSLCGPSDTFTARPGREFGMNDATSFSSTLRGTADSALNGTLVECFGPANNVDPENMVGSSTLRILGWYFLTLSDQNLLCGFNDLNAAFKMAI